MCRHAGAKVQILFESDLYSRAAFVQGRLIYVACNMRTCAVCRLHGAKHAVCRLHGTQSADCMVTVQTKDPSKTCDSFSKFQRNLRFSARINFLTKLPNLKENNLCLLTMVIIRFLACNWGKQ